MDNNITRLRAQDSAGEIAHNPTPSQAAQRGRYQFPLIEIARLVAQLAAHRDTMPLQQLQTEPCPLDPSAPLVLAARGACLERGFLVDGSVPRFGTGDRREDPKDSLDWAACARMADFPAVDEALRGFLEDPTGDNGTGVVRAVLKAARAQPNDDWIPAGEHRPENGQGVWISILTEYSNAPPDYGVTAAVFQYGTFRDPHSEQTLRWPAYWKPRERPAPPPLPAQVAP